MNTFPKIIHFIWVNFKNELDANPTIPQKYLDNLENIKKINSNYQIKIWNGYDCDLFVKKYFPNKLNLYWKFPYPIQRCDYVRFLILYIYGGIYSDFDRYSVKSYDLILDKYIDYNVILGKLPYLQIINNDIIIAKPHDNFIFKCINHITIYNYNYYFIDVCATTGPIYLMKMYYKYKDLSKIKLLSSELNPCTWCNCDVNNMDKIVSYTTLDNTWIEKNNNFFSTTIFSFIICNFTLVISFIIIVFLFYKLYKK
jgi:mannosyltransferase OCH1-like enzyme